MRFPHKGLASPFKRPGMYFPPIIFEFISSIWEASNNCFLLSLHSFLPAKALTVCRPNIPPPPFWEKHGAPSSIYHYICTDILCHSSCNHSPGWVAARESCLSSPYPLLVLLPHSSFGIIAGVGPPLLTLSGAGGSVPGGHRPPPLYSLSSPISHYSF